MKLICTKCSSENVFIKEPKKKEEVRTIDEMTKMVYCVPAVYQMTTYACKDCGYEVTG